MLFCWECSRKLRFPYKTILVDKDDREYVLHKECADKVMKEQEFYNDYSFVRKEDDYENV